MRKLRPRLSFANVVSVLALFVALGGTAYAVSALPKNSVGTVQLKKNAVTGAKVKNGSITGADIQGGLPQATSTGSAGATGAAGGDLSGSYPNPTIRPGAVDAGKLNVPASFTSALPEAFGSCGSNTGWVSWSPDVNTPVGYYRAPDGIVHLQGLARSCGSGSILFTLPPGYRPAHLSYLTDYLPTLAEAGSIWIYGENGKGGGSPGEVFTTRPGEGLELSLDGISFRCGPSGVNGCP